MKFKVQFQQYLHGQGDFGNEVTHGLTFHEEVICDTKDEAKEIIEDPIQNNYNIGKTGHEL